MADSQSGGIAVPKSAVLAELVEHILLEVSLIDVLLTAQRVERTWHSIVKSSSKLGKALFFSPSNHKALKIRGLSDYTERPCDCPRALKVPRTVPPRTMHLNRPRRTKNQRWARDEMDMNIYPVIINPFLLRRQDGVWFDIESGLEALGKTTHEDASLRRMLLTQPPVQMIILYTNFTAAHLITRKDRANGVTVADDLDTMATVRKFHFLQIWMHYGFELYDTDATVAKYMLERQKVRIKRRIESESEVDPDYYSDSDLEY